MLRNLHLLDLLTQTGTIPGTIFANDSCLLGALRHLVAEELEYEAGGGGGSESGGYGGGYGSRGGGNSDGNWRN